MPNKSIYERPPFILFADDDMGCLNAMEFHVHQRGWRADYVTSARDIIDKVNENCCKQGLGCYDAVVADINYFDKQPGPRLTGITAAREIRRNHEDIPIIFLTGFSNLLIQAEVRKIHADIITKPVDLDQLFEYLARVTQWHRENHDEFGNIIKADAAWPLPDSMRPTLGEPLKVPEALDRAITEVRADTLERIHTSKG